MINLTEHSNAAFYPPILESNEIDEPSHIEGEFSQENILKFVAEYLSDRRKFILPTEHFWRQNIKDLLTNHTIYLEICRVFSFSFCGYPVIHSYIDI